MSSKKQLERIKHKITCHSYQLRVLTQLIARSENLLECRTLAELSYSLANKIYWTNAKAGLILEKTKPGLKI